MKTYKVKISEKLSRIVEVTSNSFDEAVQDTIELYNEEEIILDSSDYVTTDFDISENDNDLVKLFEDDKFSDFILINAEKIISNLSKEELAKLAFGSLLNAKEEFQNL